MSTDSNTCKFCMKSYKTCRSVAQHMRRCNQNPHRTPMWNEGLTAETSEAVRRQIASARITRMNQEAPIRVWEVHNMSEIEKWRSYVRSCSITLPSYDVRINQGYKLLVSHSHEHSRGTHYVFEHVYLLSQLLGELPPGATVHHIDENKLNNSFDNLMLFKTCKDHTRFHKSKYAYLIYDEDTHSFITQCKYE